MGLVSYNSLRNGFVYPPYVPKAFVPPPKLPEYKDKIVIIENGISSKIVRNRVDQMVAIKDIEDKECPELLQYKAQIEKENKLITKYSETYHSDKQKLWSIIWDLLSVPVQNDVVSYIRAQYPTIQVEGWKNRYDYISSLNIIDATVHPFYLHNHDSDKTTEVLRSMVKSLSNDNYLTRKDHETFKVYFARISNAFSYLNQLSKLLNEPTQSEHQFIFNMLRNMRATPGTNIHNLINNINNKVTNKEETLAKQIEYFTLRCEEDDKLIASKIIDNKTHKNLDRDNEYKRWRFNNYGDRRNTNGNNNNDNDVNSNALINQQKDKGNVLISIQDLASIDIPDDKIKELLNKKNQNPKIPNYNNNNNSNSGNNTYNGGHNRLVTRPYNNNNNNNNNNSGGFSRTVTSTNRGSQNKGQVSFFNHDNDDEYLSAFTVEEYLEEDTNISDNTLSTITNNDNRQYKKRKIDHVRSWDKRVLVLDNGNNTSHMIINHDMLRNGPLDFEDGAAPKISGQNKNWSTTHNQYGSIIY